MDSEHYLLEKTKKMICWLTRTKKQIHKMMMIKTMAFYKEIGVIIVLHPDCIQLIIWTLTRSLKYVYI